MHSQEGVTPCQNSILRLSTKHILTCGATAWGVTSETNRMLTLTYAQNVQNALASSVISVQTRDERQKSALFLRHQTS